MLCLKRSVGEAVICRTPDGTEIRVEVIEIRGDKVRLGVEAPREVTVHREEIQAKVDKEQ